MKKYIHLLILISFIYQLSGCDQKPSISPSGRTIKVGIIAPFSGPHQAKGEEGLTGIKAAMQLQPFLQNGDRIELVVENDENDPVLTVRLLKKLVEKAKVSAIITFSGSGPVLAMAKVADAYKTPILAAIATHPDTTKHNRYVSQLCFDDNFQGTIAALFVRDELLIDKVAVVRNPDSAYSRYLASKFENKFKSIGGEIVDTIYLTEETGDLSKIMKGVYDKSPELLYLPISAQDVLRIIREVHNLGWKPRMMGSDGLISTILAQYEEGLDLVEGMLATDFFVGGMPLTPFGKKANAKDKGSKTIYAALGLEGYALLLDALDRCSDPKDREFINNQIRSTTNFKGFAGKITIGPNGKAHRPLCINAIQAGLAKFVVKVY